MGLTLTEKAHFQTRLREKIDGITNGLSCVDTWERDLRIMAEESVACKFKVAELLVELSEAKLQFAAVELVISDITSKIVAKITGQFEQDVDANWRESRYGNFNDYQQYPDGARSIIRTFVECELRVLTDNHPIGKKKLAMQNLYTQFVDKLTLCGSHKQLSELWKEVQVTLDELCSPVTTRTLRSINIGVHDGEEAEAS